MKLEAETGDGEELPRLEAVSIGFFLWRICPIDRVSQILSPLGAPMHLWINISHIDPAAEAKANEFSMSQSRQFQTKLLPGCRRSACLLGGKRTPGSYLILREYHNLLSVHQLRSYCQSAYHQ